MADYTKIAEQAAADLNTHQFKTGVTSSAEKKFESSGAKVLYDDELSTNAGYNKRIPESEGGVLDDRGRQTTGKDFEGEGGPLDKIQQDGTNDNDVVPANVPKVTGLGSTNDIAAEGKQASLTNVGSNPPGPGGSKYKGEDYYNPQSVPDSIAAEGNVAPESVTQASRETEGY